MASISCRILFLLNQQKSLHFPKESVFIHKILDSTAFCSISEVRQIILSPQEFVDIMISFEISIDEENESVIYGHPKTTLKTACQHCFTTPCFTLHLSLTSCSRVGRAPTAADKRLHYAESHTLSDPGAPVPHCVESTVSRPFLDDAITMTTVN